MSFLHDSGSSAGRIGPLLSATLRLEVLLHFVVTDQLMAVIPGRVLKSLVAGSSLVWLLLPEHPLQTQPHRRLIVVPTQAVLWSTELIERRLSPRRST